MGDGASPSKSVDGAGHRRRIPARELLRPDELAQVRERSLWRGIGMIAHAWAVIIGAIALFAWWPNPLTFVAAAALIGSRQLGLAILMHDGAHGCFTRNETLNLWLSQWLCAYPVFAETRAYRKYHLQHHAHTQTDEDPDLILSAPFPITPQSYRRKLWRDISGQTGYQQRKAQVLNALGPADAGWSARLGRLRDRLGPQIAANMILLAALSAAGLWWAYPLLWLLPLLTWYQVITRIRNIAEHAVVPDDADPLRNTRTTHANWLERALVAPYFVNYHLEHHLFFYVPAYNLPRVHALLMAGPCAGRMEVQPSYSAVLRMALSKTVAAGPRGDAAARERGRSRGDASDENRVRGGF